MADEPNTDFEDSIAAAMSIVPKATVPPASRPAFPRQQQGQPTPAQGQPTPAQGLVANHVEQIGRILDTLGKQAAELEAEIADKTDRLRQIRVSLDAFRLAQQRLRP